MKKPSFLVCPTTQYKKRRFQNLNNTSGFTLVELMVVVAIIGVLAAVAIPNYQKYQEKTRQSEAKIALAAIYTSETSFFAEQGSYTACLQSAGYTPIASTAQYYAQGFDMTTASTGTTCGPSSGSACNIYNYPGSITCPIGANGSNEFAANAFMTNGGINAPATDTQLALVTTTAVTQSTFLAGAAGAIGGTTWDQWTVDNKKALINTVSGL